jgi:hypothetical protein
VRSFHAPNLVSRGHHHGNDIAWRRCEDGACGLKCGIWRQAAFASKAAYDDSDEALSCWASIQALAAIDSTMEALPLSVTDL